VDKCDEIAMSHTNIGISVAFVRIWMLAALMDRAKRLCLYFKMSLAYRK